MADRISLLRRRMQELKLSAFIISSLTHLRYLFGFSGSNGLGVITEEYQWLITDRRYREQVKHEVHHAEVHIIQQDLFEPIKKRKLFSKGMRVGFEALHLNFRDFSRLQKAFPDVRLAATENVIEKLTIPRLPEEIEHTRRACELARRVWETILPVIRPGMTELDLSAEISYHSKKLGSERDAFEPIVASGWRSALPHGIASRKTIEYGELVVIDFGCVYEGFCSDVTRTVMIGQPSEEQRRMYEAVKEANRRAIAAAKANMPGADLDRVARDYLKERGYDKEFGHSLGHGLGLDVHSLPRISPVSKDRIPADSIITIEPGVYLPEIGGVRIEDDILVHHDGAEVLTDIDRELIIIE